METNHTIMTLQLPPAAAKAMQKFVSTRAMRATYLDRHANRRAPIERAVVKVVHRFDHQREPVRPVIPPAGNRADAHGVASHH